MKRILAIICIVILASLYVCTLVFAIINSPYTNTLFKGCVATTIFLPVVLYLYMRIFSILANRSHEDDEENTENNEANIE